MSKTPMKRTHYATWFNHLSSLSKLNAGAAEDREALAEVVRMQQGELSVQLQDILKRSEQRVQYINYVLAFLLMVTLVWAMYAAWRSGQQEKIESIALIEDSVKVLGPLSLCPGDTMTIRYTLDIKGTGIIITDDTVQYANRTVKFSEALRDYIPGDMKRTYESAWTIPEHPAMTANGNDAWHPGLYMRLHQPLYRTGQF
jgi:hypothetical protein